ncbi:MAG: thioredoxin [Candidatus Cloacimonetes bacterium]|nr:thioredoxin [Candidatus Cloacimonadota bacterium]
MSENIINLDDSNFKTELKKYKLAIVDFWAEWCGPCRMFASIFEEFALENKEVTCIKVNVDNAPKISTEYNVMSIPSIFFFKEGKLVKQTVGVLPKAMLKKIIDEIK